MSADLGPPEGYRREVRGRVTFIATSALFEELERSGLGEPDGWARRLVANPQRAGRGSTAVLRLASGVAARLKQLRRGGWLGSPWVDRFAARRRLLENLRVPLEAARRGVATPRPLALLMVEGPPRFYRAWLATEELEGARDLRSCLAESGVPLRELRAAMDLVRKMHDAGVEHRDLSLGNLALAGEDEGRLRAAVLDLDRARVHPAPLGFRLRQRALRRLERSYVKTRGPTGAEPEIRDLIYRLYAAGNDTLGSRLERGRRAGRASILVHRLGWIGGRRKRG